jgi:hypothetical protein
MRFIAHRGNIDGPNADEENNPLYLKEAMKMGYDVEVDLQYSNGTWYLGHDDPRYEIDLDFLIDRKVWVHCKTLDTLMELRKTSCAQLGVVHYFWHQRDDVTITSKGWAWAYPGIRIAGEMTVACLPELNDTDISGFKAVCTDYVNRYVDM